MKLNDLKFDKRNYRRHSDKNKEIIKKSIDEVGFGRSIVIDSENEIVCGNGVVSQVDSQTPIKVVETDGSELIVVKRTDLATNDEKRKQLAVMDNSASDTSDFDLELLKEDFSIDELSDWGIDIKDEIKKEKEKEGEVDFTEELLEEHNFIVLYFDNSVDWLQAKTLFELETVKALDSKEGFEKKGVGRVLNGAKVLDKLMGDI